MEDETAVIGSAGTNDNLKIHGEPWFFRNIIFI